MMLPQPEQADVWLTRRHSHMKVPHEHYFQSGLNHQFTKIHQLMGVFDYGGIYNDVAPPDGIKWRNIEWFSGFEEFWYGSLYACRSSGTALDTGGACQLNLSRNTEFCIRWWERIGKYDVLHIDTWRNWGSPASGMKECHYNEDQQIFQQVFHQSYKLT